MKRRRDGSLLSKLHEAKHHVRVKLDMDETGDHDMARVSEEYYRLRKAEIVEAAMKVCGKKTVSSIIPRDPDAGNCCELAEAQPGL